MSQWQYRRHHAEDLYLYHCYLYYVEHRPILTDQQFDAMEAFLKAQHPDSDVLKWVASDNASHYPMYIREGRRPGWWERRY